VRARRRDLAFYVPWAGPTIAPGGRPSGGAEVQVIHLARGLAARGVRVALITYNTAGLPDDVAGVEIVAQWRPAWRRALARRTVTLATTIWRLLRTDATVVVQRGSGATTGLVALAARVTRTRFVYSSASTVDFAFERRGPNRLAAAAYVLGIRLADEIIVQTDEQAEMCRARFARDPIVIRSVAEPVPPSAPGSDELLWIGRLAAVKNPMAFLDLAAAVPEARFTMVCVPGNYDPPGTTDELARRAAELPNLELLGPQPRSVMLERIAHATAVVSTSHYEGMPNTLLEGWSRGVPALTLHHDPDGVIMRERIGFCANGDASALADHARAMWAGRDRDPELHERCRDYALREHSPDVVLDRWIAALGLADRQTAPVSSR
jgi:glycosyltransferase involved in cell wall biosynthesis